MIKENETKTKIQHITYNSHAKLHCRAEWHGALFLKSTLALTNTVLRAGSMWQIKIDVMSVSPVYKVKLMLVRLR